MRAANCWRRAMSLPWACLMKGCSRRWVTDGRASKSFIRHLKATKYHTVTSKTLRQTNCPSSVYKSEWIKQLTAVTWTLRTADLSGSTVSDTHTSAVPLASVFKRGSLIDPSLRTTWSLSPWPRVQTSPAVAQRQVLSVMCSVCQQVMSLCDTGLPAATLQPLMSVCWYKRSSNIDSSAPHTHWNTRRTHLALPSDSFDILLDWKSLPECHDTSTRHPHSCCSFTAKDLKDSEHQQLHSEER